MGDLPNASQLANTLVGYHNANGDDWRVAKNMKDVTVWRKPSEEFSGFLYKVQGIVKDIPTRIIDYIRPGPYRLNWDSLMTSMDIVKTFDEPGCCMLRYTTAGQLWNIIAPREFVDFSYTTDYQNGLLSCEGAPAHGLLTGYIQTDLRGMLPQSAVDSAMASGLINFFVDLRRALIV
ncbi:stAR-related lipid transfer protein 4 isoform X2 [Paramormyrops kingsleyae]|uniref:stAR-related lipid transfer protein 4 isoform X2 n=1 Tax=Paramormyrops kingsleyae TaxID=1676925 RepID=UPI000CD60D9C|nr:stAR-related lipid transfer protein 4 isoform X2 [Paramormyrops kingsleyae]